VRDFLRRHPVAAYFGLVFLASWTIAGIISGPRWLGGQTAGDADALVEFPIFVMSVAAIGVALTAAVDGKAGLVDLRSRLGRWRVPVPWYVVALGLPPLLVSSVLLIFTRLLSPSFAPNQFLAGVLIGLVPGFLEEVGWTGFAFPRMAASMSPLRAAITLGVLWGLWHVPVVDSLGGAGPHGAYWLPFLLSFIGFVSAMRVLIAWLYVNTRSVLLAQLLHASSTAALVVMAPHVSPAQETLWYAVYAGALWMVVLAVVLINGARLTTARG
jgi:membrane protease YdiL (CAAX protease family)